MNEKIRAAIRFLQKALNFVFEIEKENTCFLPAVVHENASSIAEMVLETQETRAKNIPTMKVSKILKKKCMLNFLN
jgi:hypothetical protein